MSEQDLLNLNIDPIEDINIADLLNLDNLQKIQDAFAKAHSVSSIIISPDGTLITKESNPSKLCKQIIQKTPEGKSRCAKTFERRNIQNLDGPTVSPCCTNSLWSASASINLGKRHLANWVIGQVKIGPEQQELLNFAKEIGADTEEFISAADEITTVSKDKFQDIADYLFLTANATSKLAYRNYLLLKNIADLEQTKENLEIAYNFNASVINNIDNPIYVKNEQHKILVVNTAFEKLVGKKSKELVGKGENDFYPTPIAQDMQEKDNQTFAIGTPVIENVSRNGRSYSTKKTIIYDKSSKQKLMIAMIKDMTEKERDQKEKEDIQRQLYQSAKLASIGELAANVGHEINNPLTIISGNLEIVEMYTNAGELTNTIWKRIISSQKRCIKRIVDIVDGLRVYARSDSDIIEPICLQESIDKTLIFMQSILSKDGIKIVKDMPEKKTIVVGNNGKFQQVLVNLLSNAKDAMDGKEDKRINIILKDAGTDAIIQIVDNGFGIAPDHLTKIFDSFFTTKEIEKGTGLGLGIAKNIIENINGTLEVESAINKGAAFTITLPISKETQTKILENQKIIYEPLQGTALVVDDEPDIRHILYRFLSEFSLKIDLAEDGMEALRKAQKNHYDYIFTDITMPVMDGRKLIQKLYEIPKFDSSIFVITGVIAHDLSQLPVDGYLEKPFTKGDIYEMIKDAEET